jgi:NADH:ubiquinone oxidoreductase subunit 3 (subunit A)
MKADMTFLFWPPVAFIIVFLAVLVLALLGSRLAFRPAKHARDEGEAYACGEAQYDNTARPDYSVFFPFAFFFTIAHVATLIMTAVPAPSGGGGTYLGTVPLGTLRVFAMAVLYITGALTGLYILVRTDR